MFISCITFDHAETSIIPGAICRMFLFFLIYSPSRQAVDVRVVDGGSRIHCRQPSCGAADAGYGASIDIRLVDGRIIGVADQCADVVGPGDVDAREPGVNSSTCRGVSSRATSHRRYSRAHEPPVSFPG